MAKSFRSKQFDVSADDMWKRIGDFHGLDGWHPAVTTSEKLEGGAQRKLTLADGATLVETRIAEGERTYSYRIDEGPLPVANYRSTISVVDDGGGCEVRWEGEFDPVGLPEAEVVELIEGIYQAGLDAL